MGVIGALIQQPALWGVLGAFIYAAPRWVACLVACRESGAPGWLCTLEFAVALGTGAIAAAAFSAAALGLTGLKDANAISAMIGLLANPTAPALVNKLSAVVGSTLGAAIGARLAGPAAAPPPTPKTGDEP